MAEAMAEPLELPSRRPLLVPLEGAAAAVTALGAIVLVLAYVALPTRALGDEATLAEVLPWSGHLLVGLHAAVVAVAGLVALRRPATGAGVVAAAALPLPWTFSLAGSLVDIERSNAATPGPDVEGVGPLLVVLLLAGVLPLIGVVIALVTTLARARRAGLGLLGADAVALAVAVGGLWVTVAAGWYEETLSTGVSHRSGGLLSTYLWSGRGAWLGLGLAVAALLVAAVRRGAARRAVGISLVVVLVFEAVRRVLLSGELLGSEVTPYGLYQSRLVLPLLAAQILGAAGGAWLATTTDDGSFDDEVDELGAVDPGPPPDGPPA